MKIFIKEKMEDGRRDILKVVTMPVKQPMDMFMENPIKKLNKNSKMRSQI